MPHHGSERSSNTERVPRVESQLSRLVLFPSLFPPPAAPVTVLPEVPPSVGIVALQPTRLKVIILAVHNANFLNIIDTLVD